MCVCVCVCIHESTVCCERTGAKQLQIVRVRLRGKGRLEVCVCVCVCVRVRVCARVCVGTEGEGSSWLFGEPISGSSSRAPCVTHCHFPSHTAE